MKITLQSTESITVVNGCLCRVWTGHTEGGVPVTAFVHLLAVTEKDCQDQFSKELEEQPHPIELRPLKEVLRRK